MDRVHIVHNIIIAKSNNSQLDYSVAQQPHLYPPVTQNSPYLDFWVSSDSISILYYVIPYINQHTQISKESIHVSSMQTKYKSLSFSY
jgi:hypothetical protein